MSLASVVQVARLPFQAGDGGANPTSALHVTIADAHDVNPLLASEHYLGPVRGARVCFAGWRDDVMVQCQAYRQPTGRMVPQDWFELSRWCLGAASEDNDGSRMMGIVRRKFRRLFPNLRTIVSYSDPSKGHTGALYKASGWVYSPTHHGERFDRDGIGYPSGHGSWDGITVQSPKHRWLYFLKSEAAA